MSEVPPVLIPERIFQLDQGGLELENLLFRGNVPLVQKGDGSYVFGYRALEAGIQALMEEEHKAFRLDDYYLITIMLLDVKAEYEAFAPEVACFNDTGGLPLDPIALSHDRMYPPYQIPGWNPTVLHGATVTDEMGIWHHGSLVWWPFEASDSGSCGRQHLGPGNAQSYNFIGLIDFVHTTLQGLPMARKPMLLYMHGSDGINRTGAAAIAYGMHYLGMSYQDAVSKTANTATPEPSSRYLDLACTYCSRVAFPDKPARCEPCSTH